MHRRSALTVLAAVTVGLLAVTPPALADPVVASPAPRPIDDACPPHQVPEDGFADVPEDGPHEPAVDCVVHWKIANGLSATSYGPEATVTRAQLASFIARLIEATGGHLPASDVDHFADDDGSTHESSIDRLAAVGIVGGRSAGAYEPDSGVTRAQMTAFLTRAYDYRARQHGAPALDAGQDAFRDDDGNALEPAIDTAAAAGFAGGYGDGSFRPAGVVRRDQMASFLARVLDLAVEQGMAAVPVEEQEPPPPSEPPAPDEPEEPADPGNSRNCGDFGAWQQSQQWFERYRPSYGDVANLDPDGDLVACDHLHDAPGSVAQRAAGRRVVDVVQVHWTQPDERTLSSLVDVVSEADAHLTALTSGKVDLVLGETTEWVAIPAPEQPCDLWHVMHRAIEATGFAPGPGRHLLVYFPRDDACVSHGFGESPGSGIWLSGRADVGSLVHELLHNVGMGHADALYCFDRNGSFVREEADSRCQVLDAGDPYDVMGHNVLFPHDPGSPGTFGLANLLDLGAVEHDAVLEVPVGEREQAFTINRSTSGEGLRGLRITQDTRRYLVEYRAEPASEQVADDGEGGVLLRLDDPALPGYDGGLALMDMQPNRSDDDGQIGSFALRPGDVWRAPDGAFSIRTVSVTEDTATVHVMVRATG